MIYDSYSRAISDGEWHCPFPPEWVERMKHAAEVCKGVTEQQIVAVLVNGPRCYHLPPYDFLSEPQDARGLPLSWGFEHSHWPNCCVATYDYTDIPDVVVTNGHKDWPLDLRLRILTA